MRICITGMKAVVAAACLAGSVWTAQAGPLSVDRLAGVSVGPMETATKVNYNGFQWSGPVAYHYPAFHHTHGAIVTTAPAWNYNVPVYNAPVYATPVYTTPVYSYTTYSYPVYTYRTYQYPLTYTPVRHKTVRRTTVVRNYYYKPRINNYYHISRPVVRPAHPMHHMHHHGH